MNKAKFIGSLALGVFGVFIALYPLSPSIPKKSELEVASGVLLSSEFRSKVGSRFHLDGINRNFVYKSHGRLCGNVHDRLLAEIGKPISVSYAPTQTKNWSGELHSLQVYELSGQTQSICSYEQISTMIENDFQTVPLLGYLMSFFGFSIALKALSPGNSEGASNTKTWKELRSELEAEKQAEEGEKIIGEQWKNPPITDKAKRQ